ncbi:hypothetical protein TB2_000075 [Malus domestica]
MESTLAEAAAKDGEGVGGGIVPRTDSLGAEKGMTNRKEKRKAMKKMKRKQTRKEMALKEREEHDAILNNPLELAKITMIEQEEAERSERERKIFEERERAWMEAMEVKRKKQIEEEEEEEQRRIKALEEEDELSRNEQVENANDGNEVDEWDYEEGPAEIIWQGNEIILKKKRVKIPKKNTDQESRKKDSDRPTSNPLPPQSEAFSDYKSSSMSAQQLIESVAQQVPHFGTEQDKAHCPFHLKTGACRFGQRCSRVHFCPDKSSTLLIKNMYNGPGLAWEQDEGLEYTDEEVERCYEEFYEDVHTEFLKLGEIINFKVCRNGAFHLRGNVYIHYKSLDSAVVAYQSVNGRYFAGKQISCEFINVTRWKVAICGEYMKSRYKTCSRGTACNFIHCFRNPGGDYEWADSDRPPPKFWARKMVALFGYSDADDKPMVEENFGQWRNSSKMSLGDSERYGLRRSRSRGRDSDSGRRYDNENYVLEGTCRQKRTGDEDLCEENKNLRNYNPRRSRKWDAESDGELLEREIDRDRHRGHTRHNSRQQNRDHKNKTYETESEGDLSQRNRRAQHGTRKSSSQQRKVESPDEYRDRENKNHEVNWDWSDRDRDKDAAYQDNGRHSGQKRKVRCRGDHKDIKNRARDTDGERSDNNMKGDEHDSRRKSMEPSSHSSKASKFSNHGGRSTRSCSTDLSDDLLENDAERPPSHAWKRSKRLDEVSDISHDDKVPTLDLKHGRDHLSIEMREADSLVENLKSRGTHESSSVGPDDIRFNSDVLTDKEDRWEPENSSVENEIYHTSKRKAGSSESCDSGRPGPSKGRDESCDFDSEVYYYSKIGREKGEKSDRVTHSEHGKSRRKSRNKDRKLDSEDRPRQGSSQSSHRRHSSGLDDATDSSDGDKESVSAHTSAGKTVVASYAIAISLRNKQRVIYTSPIKALSNQKYREFEEEFSDVGLMTGDVTIDPNASCLVMTTEIWRSMQYKGSEITREVAWIIFDEVHCMRDRERGVVWEESIVMAPKNSRFVFLSSTVPNAKEFADWLAKIHRQPCHIVYTDYRPTPLQHYIVPSGGNGLYLVVDEKGKFREDSFQKALNALAPPTDSAKKKDNGKWQKGLIMGKAAEESDIFKMVKMIIQRQYDPVILFSFSKRECESLASCKLYIFQMKSGATKPPSNKLPLLLLA